MIPWASLSWQVNTVKWAAHRKVSREREIESSGNQTKIFLIQRDNEGIRPMLQCEK
jgi:hypothetical protein